MTTVNKNSIILSTLFLAVCLLLDSCNAQTPRFLLANDAILLAFGDSITYGTGATRQQSYPAILSQLSGHPVINAGIPGEVSAQGVQRLPALLDKHKPGLLILCHGGNDLLRKLNPAETRHNLEVMIDSARQRNIPVLLIGVPAFGIVFLKSADMYDDIAEKYALLYERDVLPRVESEPELKSDRIHPNAEGYRQIATAVYQHLLDSGTL